MKKPKQLRLKEIAVSGHSSKLRAEELRKKALSERDPKRKRKLELEAEIYYLRHVLAVKRFRHLDEFGR